MIGMLTGTVFPQHSNPIIVMVGGVGYRVYIPENLEKNILPDKTITLFIHTHVKEDALDLYGFIERDEQVLFELLLTVSGIGPRTAMTIVNRGASSIQEAVASSDVSFFTSIPRVGKKNSQKIIIELKNKLGSIADLDLSDNQRGETKDILDALTGMGFAKNEVQEAIKNLPRDTGSVEEKIRRVLKLLGKR